MDESNLFSNQRGRLPNREAITLADSILKSERQKRPVNIIFRDDAFLADLNSHYRQKRGSTDVLSFPADPELGILGEIYISVDTARRQALDFGVTLREEILRLVCHGCLHLCGYDHHRRNDSARMEAKAEKYLGRFLKNA
jgi:rRNA maturation RNase YbeY